MTDGSLYLVTGSDPTLRANALDRLIDGLLGGNDRSLALDDFTIPARRAAEAAADIEVETPVMTSVMTALSSPPFLIDRRVVLVRDIGNLASGQAAMLGDAVSSPVDGVVVVLVAGGGRTPAALDKALNAAGVTKVGPESEKTGDVLTLESRDQHVKLTGAARERIATHFGEDAGRVPEFIDLLHGAFGDNASLDVTDVEPYLGEAGTIPRYELTGALDRGDSAAALDVLQRLLHASSGVEAKPLHPMQVMATLVAHYQRMLRIDDPAIHTAEQAATAIGRGIKPYPAKKALEQSQRLGTDGLRDAFGYLAQAELDLRGASGIPEQTVIEVLTVRLAALSRRKGASGGSRPKSTTRVRR